MSAATPALVVGALLYTAHLYPQHTHARSTRSSTWALAAPACSGSTSPYTVIVRYANWWARGWPCPAGVGGDPPFPSTMWSIRYTHAARRLCEATCAAWGRTFLNIGAPLPTLPCDASPPPRSSTHSHLHSLCRILSVSRSPTYPILSQR